MCGPAFGSMWVLLKRALGSVVHAECRRLALRGDSTVWRLRDGETPREKDTGRWIYLELTSLCVANPAAEGYLLSKDICVAAGCADTPPPGGSLLC